MNDSFLKRTWAEIDLDALAQNYHSIAARLSPSCRMIAVVKADAYGHGAVASARLLRDQGVSYFAVSNIEEAAQLRGGGITEPILILSHTPTDQAARLAKLNITQTIISREYGEALHAAAKKADVQLRIHIKVDTGMSRVGFFYQQANDNTVEDVAAVCRLPHFDAEGIFTHFAVADEAESDAYTRTQFALFTDMIDRLGEKGIHFTLRHCCNSAATLRFPEMHLDAVRPGIILYGLPPAPWMTDLCPLTPVMAVKTAVTMTKTVPPDTCISYGRTHKTAAPLRVATVPIGYADGLPRRFSDKWRMEIDGTSVPLLGRICMDQCMLDISALPSVCAGTTVTVMGGNGICRATHFANAADTIPYEVVCDIGKRVPRIFCRNGRMVDQLNYLVPVTE